MGGENSADWGRLPRESQLQPSKQGEAGFPGGACLSWLGQAKKSPPGTVDFQMMKTPPCQATTGYLSRPRHTPIRHPKFFSTMLVRYAPSNPTISCNAG